MSPPSSDPNQMTRGQVSETTNTEDDINLLDLSIEKLRSSSMSDEIKVLATGIAVANNTTQILGNMVSESINKLDRDVDELDTKVDQTTFNVKDLMDRQNRYTEKIKKMEDEIEFLKSEINKSNQYNRMKSEENKISGDPLAECDRNYKALLMLAARTDQHEIAIAERITDLDGVDERVSGRIDNLYDKCDEIVYELNKK